MLTTPIKVGRMELLHRIVLAPLTRSRSKLNTLTQTPIHAEYYRQRASKGGLLISEATFISPETVGFQRSPGIFTAEQVESWKQVTQAVHEKGGYIYCQLWHIGRVAHPSFAAHALVKAQAVPTPPGVSASDVPTGLPAVTYDGQTVDGAVPRALETKEIPRLIDDYRHAARCAIEAGFDGVELHGAHGYLIDQFLNDGVNKRTDQYGGSLENRARLLLEVIDALIAELGADRVACRLSPHNNDTYSYNGVKDSNPDAIYGYAIKELSKRKLAYLLLTEPRWDPKFKGDAVTDPGHQLPSVNADKFRSLYEGVLIGAGGYTPLSGLQALELGKYDLIGFGRWFISNPDIVTRIQYRQPLNIYRRETFYIWKSPEPEGIDEGYTDYPTFDQVLRQIGYSEEEVKDLSSRVLSDEEAEQIVARSHDKGLKYPLITQVRLGNSTSAGSRL